MKATAATVRPYAKCNTSAAAIGWRKALSFHAFIFHGCDGLFWVVDATAARALAAAGYERAAL